jgi:transcriptional regulator with XRE-family HTH domain
MPDELRNSRTVHNRLSSQLLYRLMDFRGWTELKLAEMSGILPSVVSAHLCGSRRIGAQHLTAYLRVLDREERVAFLDAWLRDNMGYEVIANLLDGTKTHSMSSVSENQCRMLDWWATAIAGDSKFAKIFTRFSTKAGFRSPSVLLLPVSTAAAQLQTWLLEQASSVWYLVRSLCFRVEHAAVALVTLVLALCQQGKVTQQAGELAERTLATSLVATSFVAPALAETTNSEVDTQHASPPPPTVLQTRKGKFASPANAKRSLPRAQARDQKAPALRIGRTIDREWHRLVAARKSVHSAFARLIRDANPQQSEQRHRKQRLN